MSNALQACPHCGAALPAVQDAFCSECRNPLDVISVQAGGVQLTVREIPVAQPDTELLSSLLPFNAAAFAIVAASFLPALGICFMLGDDRDGMTLLLGGPLALMIDLAYRLRSPSGHLLLPGGGGKFLYFPVWMLAIFWCLYGLWQLMS